MPCPRVLAALCGALLCASGLFAFSGDFCDSSQCLHGGTCLLDQDRKPPFHCLCPEGFTGLICNETERGPCFPNPCHSDAECQVIDDFHRGDVFTQYICKCPHGYTGIHCEIVCTSPLGMETGAIADSQISASSMHLGFMGLQRWAPYLARLHLTGIVNAWTSSNYDRSPWIQVNLMRKMRVTGVVTQGASRAGSAEYLKTFKVAYSTNGRKFQFIQGAGESGDKIFMGNVDNSGLKVNLFETPLEVQYVRLVPMICHRGCTLRFELLGCELNGCAEPLGLKDNTIPSKQITASSFYKTWGLSAFSWYPFYARLDNQGKFNAWTAQTNSASEWLQADEDHFVAEMPAFAHPGEAVSHWGASVLDEVLERGWKRCRRRLGSPSAPGGSGCPGTGRTLGHPASPTSFHFSLHSKHGNQGRERKLTPTRTCCVPGSGLCALYMSLSLV
ncbi:lactadherin isoform X1 [Phocoena sinus]|uniref:Milk fat globule EGF and factor V/VIII domain containing n=1 Tax=Phocoena sinus TaxID=42100 RepID=A0A8C9B7T0_PHOSS|nr:lactadherin isoform X1 [Phocoena sinus]